MDRKIRQIHTDGDKRLQLFSCSYYWQLQLTTSGFRDAELFILNWSKMRNYHYAPSYAHMMLEAFKRHKLIYHNDGVRVIRCCSRRNFVSPLIVSIINNVFSWAEINRELKTHPIKPSQIVQAVADHITPGVNARKASWEYVTYCVFAW